MIECPAMVIAGLARDDAMRTLIFTILAAIVACWLLRRWLVREIRATCAEIARLFKRPNPHSTWQDAYAPRCQACGYDLRASPNHCPECGEAVPPYERTIIHYLIKIGDGPPRSPS